MNDIVCNWNPINNWQQHHKILNGFDIQKVMAFAQCRVYNVRHIHPVYTMYIYCRSIHYEMHESMGWRRRQEKNDFGWNRAEYMNKQILFCNWIRFDCSLFQIKLKKRKKTQKKRQQLNRSHRSQVYFFHFFFAVVFVIPLCFFFLWLTFRHSFSMWLHEAWNLKFVYKPLFVWNMTP